MNYISNDLKYLIFEFSGNKNMKLVWNDFDDYLEDIKKSVLNQLDKGTLFINYQLERYIRFINNDYFYEKKYLEEPKKLLISRNNFNDRIGYISNKKIIFYKEFTDNLLPCSEFSQSSRNNLGGKVIYWEVKDININDLLIFKKILILK